MPHLQDLWSEVSKANDDVVFLCVNIGDEKSVIEKWWSDDGFTLRAVRQDGDKVSKAFGVRAYPTNYILDPEGKVAYRGVGWDEAAVRAVLGAKAD